MHHSKGLFVREAAFFYEMWMSMLCAIGLSLRLILLIVLLFLKALFLTVEERIAFHFGQTSERVNRAEEPGERL